MSGWQVNDRTLCVGALPGRKQKALYEETLAGLRVLAYLKSGCDVRVQSFLDELAHAQASGNVNRNAHRLDGGCNRRKTQPKELEP